MTLSLTETLGAAWMRPGLWSAAVNMNLNTSVSKPLGGVSFKWPLLLCLTGMDVARTLKLAVSKCYQIEMYQDKLLLEHQWPG
jgi:hypothetical protein